MSAHARRPDPATANVALATLYRIANATTLARIGAIPVLVYLLIRAAEDRGFRLAAILAIVVLQLSDVLDGFLARLARQRSAGKNPLGRLADPLADKLYLGVTYITLSLTHGFPLWVTWVVVARDLLLVAGWLLRRIVLSINTVVPNLWGKLADAFQALLVLAFLLQVPEPALGSVRALTVALTLISGAIYGLEGWRVSRAQP